MMIKTVPNHLAPVNHTEAEIKPKTREKQPYAVPT